MSFFEDLNLGPILYLTSLRDTLNHHISASMSTASCSGEIADECRDDAAAIKMKAVAIAAILVAGVIGVAIPLLGKKRRFLRTDGGLFVFAKAFAAGVILATGFVHMLHDAQSALTNPCLPKFPWTKFPFSGFVTMLAALLTLVFDFVGTQFYEKKHREEEIGVKRETAAVAGTSGDVAEEEEWCGITVVSVTDDVEVGKSDDAEDDDGKMHIVGMHAHAAAHRHSHAHGDERACEGHASGSGHRHGHAHEDDGHVSSHVRHVVVSQRLRPPFLGRVLVNPGDLLPLGDKANSTSGQGDGLLIL